MGKISDALAKAMHGEDQKNELKSESEAEEVIETLSSPETSAPPETDLEEQPAFESPDETMDNEASGQLDERLHWAVNKNYFLPEIFKTLRSRILLPKEGKAVPKTVMVTSVAPREGKSFISANLGISLAQGVEQHSLLVSCDLRRPSLSNLFGVTEKKGLVDYLRGKQNIADVIHKTSVNKLSIIPSGKPPANPAELLSSSRMRSLVEELAERYEDRIIIFDSPPYQLAAESAVLAKMVDSIVVVVRQGGAAKHEVKKLIGDIESERLLGVVYNGHTTNIFDRTIMKGYGAYPNEAYNYN